MKKLDKEQIEQLANLTAEVRLAEAELTNARDEVNNLISGKLNGKIDAYNELMTKVNEFVEEITGAMAEYADSKDTSWSESEAGSYYEDWKDEWESIDTAEVDRVDEVELDTNLADVLEQVASEPVS